MIVRLIIVDPHPPKGESDLVVYQVPENGRAHLILVELLEHAGMEWALIETPPRTKK